jgi:Domain of unknown function (DUF4476)
MISNENCFNILFWHTGMCFENIQLSLKKWRKQIMKSIFTLLISTVISILSFANHDEGTLSVSYLGSDAIYVTVNNTRYSDNDRDVVIENLRAGYQTVTVYKERTKRRKNGWIFGNGNGIFGNGYEVLYSSSVYVKPGYFTDVVINRFGKAMVDETPMDSYGRRGNNDNTDRGNDGDGRDRDHNRGRDHDRKNGGLGNNGDDKDRDHHGDTGNGGWGNNDDNRDRDHGRDNGNGGWGNNGNNGTYGRPMNDRDFDRAKEAIRHEVFDNTRLDIAKHIINQNMMTTMQVKELVQMFSFDNSKLDLAKYAYTYTTDRNNYYLIYDAFSFSDSKEKLARYIREFR